MELILYYTYQDKPEKTYQVSGNEVIIGRPKNIPIHLDLSPDLKVSRPHARIFYKLSAWWVEDLHSKYETMLNGRAITEAMTLSPGDTLQMGETVLRVEFVSHETELPPGFLESQVTVDEVQPPSNVSEDTRTELLANFATIIASYSQGQALWERLIEEIGNTFPYAEHRAILVIDNDKELLPLISWPAREHAHVSFTLVRQAITSQKALHWVCDMCPPGKRAPSLYDTIAALCAPMLFNGRVIGVLYIDTTRPETSFTEADRDLLSQIATILAPSIKFSLSNAFPAFPSVFISYAPPDREFVDQLAADLRRRRVKVWFDERLQVGENRRQQIKPAINTTDVFVLVASPESVDSEQVQWELNTALEATKKILPLRYTPCNLPKAIQALVALDMHSGQYQESLQKLVEAIYEIPKSYIADQLKTQQKEEPMHTGHLKEQQLPFTLRKKIVEFLASLPNVHDSSALRAFLYNAGLDTQLQNQIKFDVPPAQFFQLLVPTLWSYGTLGDGRNALKAVLESAKDYVGQQRKEYCDTLIRELNGVLGGEEYPRSQDVNTPMRILFLAANPHDTDRLRLDQEARTIDERLRTAEFRDRFDLVSHWAVRHTDLSEYLLRHTPHIVHFSGHGSKSGKIVLEDENGNAQAVSPEALRQLFRILKDNIRCVVLNACLSANQAEAIVQEIDCVVGMSEKIGDDAAIRFAGGFYRALGYGRSVQTAFELGRNEIDLTGLDEGAIPKLLVKPGVNAADITFI
jgi:hypothetical protein